MERKRTKKSLAKSKHVSVSGVAWESVVSGEADVPVVAFVAWHVSVVSSSQSGRTCVTA